MSESEIGCLTSHWTIFQLYMRRHIDVQADWRRSWTYGRANAIDISQGSLTCPSKHRHGTTLFIRWFRHTAPISRLLRSRWGYGGHILNLNPPGPHGGKNHLTMISKYGWLKMTTVSKRCGSLLFLPTWDVIQSKSWNVGDREAQYLHSLIKKS